MSSNLKACQGYGSLTISKRELKFQTSIADCKSYIPNGIVILLAPRTIVLVNFIIEQLKKLLIVVFLK
jgi:hypothetical protein